MRKALLSAAVLLAVTGFSLSPSAAADTESSSGQETTIYSASAIAGTWSSMGMPPVVITANRAAGPASRLLLHLPKNLQKTGKADLALGHTTDNTWAVTDGKVTVSFTMTSENFGVLKIVGDTPEHRLELPLSRL
ncbi:hypothetical protein [Acetobacter oeni]|uniref:Lipocalin-like domain-containing protein n=1 Tax=Acetobacter oeni TaxID=304077 RepID=A0A511XJV5_9PROT|nr:hypothetical protein [Acetobacter oeni]MBB3883459.1 hypothetical protein [Acetobacter oeni]NHO19429.1 hypothetical protein [Acetobacter oeni]GBR04060.1 hypothetical protein AA21952_1288 [Acetobacter oeni LMG 21952]GEN63240.1 hypothetical protein AOE01nite_14640 [Acetobacter oeni]